MAETVPFRDVLELVDQLEPDEQRTIVEIINNRLREEGRRQLVEGVLEARKEFKAGLCAPRTPEELIDEASS